MVPSASPSRFLFIQFIQITSLNKRDKKSFDLVSFEDIQIESRAVAGDTSAQAEQSPTGGTCRASPQAPRGGAGEAAPTRGRGFGASWHFPEPVQWMSRRWSSVSVASAAGAPNEPVCLNSE